MAPNLSASNIFGVKGMVAVITGGGTGIGLVMARALVANGAKHVYILGRRLEVLEAAARDNPGLTPVQCDVTSKASLQAAVDYIAAEAGYVNLVVANSGVMGPPVQRWDTSLSVSELRESLFGANGPSMEDFTSTLHVNVTGAMFTLYAFLDLLDAGNKNALKGGYGAPLPGSKVPSIMSQVVFTSSIAAFSRHRASGMAYASSKAAIMHLTKHAATNLAKYQIRSNALAPGLFPSELAQGLIANRNLDEEGPDHPMFIPAQRFGSDEEMAGSILYLASRAGGYCNGFIMVPDGGRLSVMTGTY